MAYYQSNAVYDRLFESGDANFVWVSGNSWILLYGNGESKVKLVVFLVGKTSTKSREVESDRLERARSAASRLAGQAGVESATVIFDDTSPSISEVELDGQKVSLDQLKDRFERAGLAVRQGATGKAINDASSSAYHNWQRSSLGAIKVSDIDLIYVSNNGTPSTICELKRSYLPLDHWSPYPADYANFDLVKDFAVRAGVKFRILYNVRHKTPKVFDDASRLAIYKYSKSKGPSLLGQLDFEDFVAGKMLT